MLPGDPNITEQSTPAQIMWSIPMDDGSTFTISNPQQPVKAWSEDGSTLYVYWPGTETEQYPIQYDGVEDYNAHRPKYNYYPLGSHDLITDDPLRIDGYIPTENFNYVQSDGQEVSIPYYDVIDLIYSIDDGSAQIDYGFGNIAKDPYERKNWTEMFSTGDFSDFLPNFVDLAAGSAPLFFKQTAWPMAIGNAVSASQGLDPRLYNNEDNTYYRLSDDMTGDKYILNTLLSGTVPATEHVAGIIGGGGGIIGRPIQSALRKAGAPAAARYGVDIGGEGLEEVVASLWEDLQSSGLNNWLANPVYETDSEGNIIYDQNGNPVIKYDSTGHEIRDPNTPADNRVSNFASQIAENMLAGTVLGGVIGSPRIAMDSANNTGYMNESRERRLLRQLENAYGVPHYRNAKTKSDTVKIGPEDIGTYGKMR